MVDIVKIAADSFEKKPDGAWVATKNSDIVTDVGGVIRITPGMEFMPGRSVWGLNIAQALEEVSMS